MIYLNIPWRFEQIGYQALDMNLKTISELSAFSVSPALYFGDTDNINEALTEVRQLDLITFIKITNIQGKVLYLYIKKGADSLEFAKSNNTSVFSKNGENLLTKRNITYNNEEIGFIELAISVNPVKSEMDSSRNFIAVFAFGLILAGLFFAFSTANYITKPLLKISKIFENVANGDFSVRAKDKFGDELGVMINSFNKMIYNLETAYSKLQLEIYNREQTEIALREAQNEVLKALENEKELSKLKSNFVSMVSHEYRTPLTVILSSSYLLEKFFQMHDEKEFKKYIERIQLAIKELTTLINNVIIIQKDGWNIQESLFENINLKSVVEEIVQSIEVIDNYNHKCIINYNQNIEFIKTSRTHLWHILTNLLTNAMKYSPKNSEVIISIINTQSELKIIIKDYGIGIPDKLIPAIFDSFSRGENVGSIPGIGLGLNIVHKSVNFLNGKIEVNSELGIGTEFTVSLPFKKDNLS